MFRQLLFDLRARLAALFGRGELRRRVDEEMRFHLEMRERRLMEQGVPASEARDRARREFGNRTTVQQATLDSWRYAALDTLVHDTRYALRMLWRSPGFACVAVLSLALAIGANAALFSLIDALLLRDLPVREPAQLVQVQRIVALNNFAKPTGLGRADYDGLRQLTSIFADVGGFVGYNPPPDVAIDGAAEPARPTQRVTSNFFGLLGVRPVIGRIESDTPAAILSYRFWEARFQGDPNVLGRVIHVDNEPYAITGVAPPDFLGLSLDGSMDLWLIRPDSSAVPPAVIARLQPGISVEQTQTAVEVLMQRLDEGRTGIMPSRAVVVAAGKGFTSLRETYRGPLMALMALVSMVLLIACTNIGNLLVARNTSRLPELTVRTAMGARRSRLIVQLAVESLLLAGVGATFAWLVAHAGVAAILSMLPLTEIPEQLTLRLDTHMLGFTAAVSLFSALLFSLAPAWRATRIDLAASLRSAAHAAAFQRRRRLDRWLVAAQVSLSVVLLTGAGLFLQTLRNTANIDPGFDAHNLLQVQVDTRSAGYGPRQTPVQQIYQILAERLAAIPGVEAVTASRNALMAGAANVGTVRAGDLDVTVYATDVAPRFFETLRIPLVRGRILTPEDQVHSDFMPVLVSESYVNQFYPGEDALGKPAGGAAVGGIIVGVVRNARLVGVRAEEHPMIYRPALRGQPDRLSAFLIRTAGDPEALAQAVQREVRAIHPRLLSSVRTIQGTIDRSLARERLVAAFSGFFGALGLALAGMGLFGVASFTVAQRTSEIGIRIALGAGRWSVIREALAGTAAVFVLGLAIGSAASAALARAAGSLIEGLLFGLAATDQRILLVVMGVMGAVAAVACLLPAIRAVRIDPLRAIRYE